MEYNSETNMSINEAVIRLKSQIKNVQPNGMYSQMYSKRDLNS